MEKDMLQPELPIPDEVSARQSCLSKGVNTPHLAMVKDFLWLYIDCGSTSHSVGTA